jgi:hypothetical protein
MDDQELAALVLADLEAILERARTAYLERLPGLRRLPSEAVDAMLAATRRTMELFCRYYVTGTLDAQSWQMVRDATIDRAGDVFSEQEILEIMDTARSVGVEFVRELWRGHPDLTDADRAKVASAVDRYVSEIAEQEDRLRRVSPGRLDDVLADLEADGSDLR